MSLPAVYRPDEVAEHLGVDIKFIYKAVQSGDLEVCRLGTHTWRVTPEQVAAYLAKRVAA